jgi:hypothetical protein
MPSVIGLIGEPRFLAFCCLTATTDTDASRSFAHDLGDNMTSNSAVGSYSYPPVSDPRPHAVSSAGGAQYTYDTFLCFWRQHAVWPGQELQL